MGLSRCFESRTSTWPSFTATSTQAEFAQNEALLQAGVSMFSFVSPNDGLTLSRTWPELAC